MNITGKEALIEFGKLCPIENKEVRDLLSKVVSSLISTEEKLAYLDGYLKEFKIRMAGEYCRYCGP